MMSDKLREAAKAALEWLKDERSDTWTFMGGQFYKDRYKHTKALAAALAEQTVKESLTVAEPVAWTTMPEAEDWCFVASSKDPTGKLEGKWFPLYTAPPRREWVGLTAEDINQFETWFDEEEERKGWVDPALIAKYFEAKLREKNGG
jgi:hypothetical protein